MKPKKVNIIELAMRHKQVSIAVTVMLSLAGVWALFNMPRQENPSFTVRQGLVIALLPGADELQTEKRLTEKIEQYLFGFEEVRKEKTYSTTIAGQVVVTVQLQDWVKENKKFWSTLQHGINTVLKQELPPNAIGPIVNSDFGETVALMLTVSSPTRSYAEIEKYLEKVEDGIKTLNKTSKIKRFGAQQQQVYVTLDDARMRQYPFDFSAIAGMLRAQNTTAAGGEIDLAANNVPLFNNSLYRTESDIADQIIYGDPGGKIVRLKDIATIERRYQDTKSYIRMGEDRVMMLSVEMQPGYNIVQFGEELDEKIGQVTAGFPGDVTVKTIVSQPKVVDASIKHFFVEFGIAIAAVVAVVMLLLPFNIAIISAVACPISILITFGILNVIGFEIHQVTLAALIIVLGMVVDNAIVVVDDYIEKLDEGLSRWEAAWRSATELSLAIFTATACIIFAFGPLAIALTGTGKDFVFSLPVTVGVALFSSFLVAVLLIPYMCYVFIKKGLKHKAHGKPPKSSVLDVLQENFNKALEFCFRHAGATLAVGVLSVALAFLIGSKVEQEQFPVTERDQFNLEVWLPPGTPLPVTEAAVKKLEQEIKADKRIVQIASFVGTGSPRFYFTYAPEASRENYAQIFINTVSEKATKELTREYLRKFEGFLPEGNVRVRLLSMGESKAPLEVRIIGEDISQMKKVAKKVKSILEAAEGTNFIRDDYEEDYLGVSTHVKQNVANRLGVTNAAITQTLGGGIDGVPVSTLWEGDTPIDIVLRLDPKNRSSFEAINNLYISTTLGGKIPLKEVAELKPAWHTGNIIRRNGLRTLTVRSEAQLGLKASTILAEVQPELEAIALPEGIRLAYGGDHEETLEQQPNQTKSMGISVILIFLTLLFQFRSITKVLIIMSTFLLSLLGAMTGLYITGNPFGLTAFMGVVSLIGIVVRNGIILVGYADELVHKGHTIKDAALAAGKRRMRPIFLTSAAAAVGVIPMIVGKSPLWGPLGSVLAVGLIFSMILTLFVVPVLYYKFVKPEPGTHAAQVADSEMLTHA